MKGKRDSDKHSSPPAPVQDEEDRDMEDTADGRRYRAPALEKGLDILELLAGEAHPMAVIWPRH